MTRPEAQAAVDAATIKVDQFSAVLKSEAATLLGEARYTSLMADRLRSAGPNAETIYSWNVVDYLDEAGPFRGNVTQSDIQTSRPRANV